MKGSGRVLQANTRVTMSRLRGRKGTIESSGQEIASLRVRWVRLAEFPSARFASVEVNFPDGDHWSMDAELPAHDPAPRRRFGRTVAGHHILQDRLLRVRDRTGSVIGEASWPEPSEAEQEAERDARASEQTAARQKAAATARQAADRLRERRGAAHRAGKLKWLIATVVSGFLLVGFVPASISGFAIGEPGLGLGFAIASGVLAIIFAVALRSWRDAQHCWSCGRDVVERPESCPFCGVAKPRSSGVFTTVAGARPARASSLIASTTGRWSSGERRPVIAAGDVPSPLALEAQPALGWTRYRLGAGTAVLHRWRVTEFETAGSLPMEEALLAWRIVAGDHRVPVDSGGGGGG